MSYRITKCIFTTHVPINGNLVQSLQSKDGFDIRWNDYGYIVVTRPEWKDMFHVGPSLLLAVTSEHVHPAPQDDTKVGRRPRETRKEAA